MILSIQLLLRHPLHQQLSQFRQEAETQRQLKSNQVEERRMFFQIKR
jgi:hypothetical protein